MSAPIDIEALEASIAAHKALTARVSRLVDRILPEAPRAHGFYDPEGFVSGAVVRYWRRRLHLVIAARLRGKRDGHEPRIGLPRNSEHLFGPGAAMHDVSKFLEAQNGAR